MLKYYRWNRNGIVVPPHEMKLDKCYEGRPHTSKDGASSKRLEILDESGKILCRIERRFLQECTDSERTALDIPK
jgi:hypothetical protein